MRKEYLIIGLLLVLGISNIIAAPRFSAVNIPIEDKETIKEKTNVSDINVAVSDYVCLQNNTCYLDVYQDGVIHERMIFKNVSEEDLQDEAERRIEERLGKYAEVIRDRNIRPSLNVEGVQIERWKYF